MTRHLAMIALVFALFTTALALPSHAYADDPAPEATPAAGDMQTGTAGAKQTCDSVPEAQGGALIGRIVPCLVHTIQISTVTFTEQMVTWLQPLLLTFLVLVVVLYGLRVVQHEPEVYKQGFLLLVKIAVVTTILADLGNVEAFDGSGGTGKLIPAVYGIMADAQKLVTGAITTTNLHCDVANFKGAQTPMVWATLDCVMGKLYGFTVGTGGKPSMLLMTSVAGLMTGFLFGGAWGVAVFFGMIGVLWTMFGMVIRTIVGFLTGYLIICLLLILTPLLLPLIFLRGTAPYYESYTRTMMAAFLTPIIITAYTMFALIIYDKMLFADDSIVQKLFKYDSIKNALQPAKKGCELPVTGDPLAVRFNTNPNDADADSLFSLPNLQNLATPTLSGGNDACGLVKFPQFKMNKMDGMEEGKDKEELTKIFNELVQLFILAYLINQGQAMLPDIVTQLVGRRSTTTAVQGVMSNQGKYAVAYQRAIKSATDVFQTSPGDKGSGYKSGGTFMRTMPTDVATAFKNAGSTYFNTLKNKS